jgi:hypothetical protein
MHLQSKFPISLLMGNEGLATNFLLQFGHVLFSLELQFSHIMVLQQLSSTASSARERQNRQVKLSSDVEAFCLHSSSNLALGLGT